MTTSRVEIGARFIRSGFWLLLLALLMSGGMVLHYVVGVPYPTGHELMGNATLWWACPWTLSTAVVFGGALCMIAIGAVHATLGRYPRTDDAGAGPTAGLRICVLSLIAMFLTGYVGYFLVDAVWPSFYYTPVTAGKNLWLLLQLGCMVLFALGVAIVFADIRRASHEISAAPKPVSIASRQADRRTSSIRSFRRKSTQIAFFR